MSHLARGPGKAGDRWQANASKEPTLWGARFRWRTGGDT
jgi:hypothetical protein